MLIFNYPSKNAMKLSIGETLRYIETSIFGEQYRADGWLIGANRPHITGKGREFFAQVLLEDGKIVKVK